MTHSVERPLLFLDVDGPLIPFGTRPHERAPRKAGYGSAADIVESKANPLLARLNPDHGRRLLALGCDLVWATTWMADANELIAPRIGLPELPLVMWPDTDDNEPAARLHWKTSGLVAWAAGRPFVWVDDEITDADRAWVSVHYPEKALLHRVDPGCGLTFADFYAIEEWLARR